MSRIWLIGGLVGVTAFLVLATALAVTRNEAEFEPGTPESVVQQFFEAVENEDYAIAHNFYSKDLGNECTVESLATPDSWSVRQLAESRVVFEDTKYLNGSAVVVTRVTRISGDGLFGSSESSHEERLSMVEEDGTWKFSEEPWPRFGCPRRVEPIEAPAPTTVPETSRSEARD